MSTETKVRIYKTVVRPARTYAPETRANTTKAKNVMRAVEMKTLKTIKGMNLREQISSKVDGRNGQRMKSRILGDLSADALKDGARAGHMPPKRLNHIKKSR
ncbi:hypothetical protein Trydic_g962 [Trypoxylus dichotomus]